LSEKAIVTFGVDGKVGGVLEGASLLVSPRRARALNEGGVPPWPISISTTE
jgi:hypothetical protein